MIRYQFESSSSNSRLTHVGTYKRTLPVSLDRMYENALDWEHLPYVHSSSFKSISPLKFGSWGWLADVTDKKDRTMQLELRLDRSARRWITRNLRGDAKGAEIWTHVFVVDERQLDLVIDFFVPLEGVDNKDKVGMAYAKSYERLYDEDIQMMSERQFQLDIRLERRDPTKELELSVPKLLPIKVLFSGREYLINKEGQDWYVYPSRCPHLLGPLEGSEISDGVVTCPWHGYKFDLRNGDQILDSRKNKACSLGILPKIRELEGKLRLSWS